VIEQRVYTRCPRPHVLNLLTSILNDDMLRAIGVTGNMTIDNVSGVKLRKITSGCPDLLRLGTGTLLTGIVQFFHLPGILGGKNVNGGLLSQVLRLPARLMALSNVLLALD